MKRRPLLFLAANFVFACLVFGLSACEFEIHTHTYVDSVVAPTCTEKGYTLHACECGNSYKDTYIDALGHSFGTYVSDDNATCTQDCTKTAHCTRTGCNETHTVSTLGTKLEHTYDQEVATEQYLKSAATCTAKAVYYKSCTCGAASATDTFAYGESLEHTKSTEWSSNDTHHWLEATCGCLIRFEKGAHIDEDGDERCDVCDKSLASTGGETGGESGGETGGTPETPTTPTETATEGVGYEISDNGKYAVVKDYSGAETKVVIASTYQGLPVKKIQPDAFYMNHDVTSVTIPDSVTSIGSGAFEDCQSLTSVTIGNGVTFIGEHAFNGCQRLSIILGKSVAFIGEDALYTKSVCTRYYTGTPEDWDRITIENNHLSPDYYYSATKPVDTENTYWHYNAKGEIELWEVEENED